MTKPTTTQPVKKAERQPSKLYAIKSFKGCMKKLALLGLITPEQQAESAKMAHKMMETYMNE